MKKISKLMTIAMAVVLAIGSANVATAAVTNSNTTFKYAVVDVPRVVENSQQVASLKKQRQEQERLFSKSLQDAQKKLQAETNATKKKALEDSLTKSLNAQKDKMNQEYAQKLQAIDKNISAVIAQQARANGYKLVVAKSVVLYSEGTDITNDVMKAVK